MHAKRNSVDLTQGSITPLLLKFAFPILMGQFFQYLYNSVDSVVVGRFVSTTALAAVTSSGDISSLLVSFFTGLSAGAGVLFSRYFGAKDYQNLKESIHTALAFSLILGVVMAVLGIVLTPWLLKIVACPQEVLADAGIYLRIYLAGVFFTSLYNVGSGVLRAVGDSRDPFIYLVIASITNIVLDVVFVVVFHMGVMGVALATVIAQALSVALVFRNMLRTDDVYKLSWNELKIKKKHLLEIMDLGLPAGLQMAIISISNLFVQRFINMAGVAAMGGIGVAKKVDKFVVMVPQTLALASGTFVSQNLGAKKPERAFQGMRCTLVWGIAYTVVGGIVLYIFSDAAIALFTADPDTITHGSDMLRVVILFYVFQIVYHVYSNVIRGFGKSRAAMVLSVLGMVVVRQLYLQIAMAVRFDVRHIYFAYPIGWVGTTVCMLIYFYVVIVRPYRKITPHAKLF